MCLVLLLVGLAGCSRDDVGTPRLGLHCSETQREEEMSTLLFCYGVMMMGLALAEVHF